MASEELEMDDIDSTSMEKGKVPPAAITTPPNNFEKVFQPCLAEIVGTMFFVFIGCVSVIENAPEGGRMQPALVHGLAVAVLVAVMANISGAHFNPPFTIAIYLCGGMELMMVAPYLFCQLIGGVLGAGMAKVMTPEDHYFNATGAAFNVLKSEDQLAAAIFGEIAMTCLITMVVLLVALNEKTKTPLAPVLVGCIVISNVLAGGDVSGACMNPARAFGPAVVANYWTYHWVYWAGPIAGALLAAGLLRTILGDENMRLVMK